MGTLVDISARLAVTRVAGVARARERTREVGARRTGIACVGRRALVHVHTGVGSGGTSHVSSVARAVVRTLGVLAGREGVAGVLPRVQALVVIRAEDPVASVSDVAGAREGAGGVGALGIVRAGIRPSDALVEIGTRHTTAGISGGARALK